MVAYVTDTQVVGEVEAVLFTLLYQGPVNAHLILKNSGVNTMNYRIQELANGVWTDMGDQGSDFYNTLMANQVKLVKVASGFTQVQIVGNASGGAMLEFSVDRYFNRPSGGLIPILTV